MHLITIAYGVSACQLLFKTKEAATAAWDKLTTHEISAISLDQLRTVGGGQMFKPAHVQDDFGRQFFGTVAGAVIEDLDQSAQGQIEQMLHNARTQKQANDQANHDPKLGGAARGPAILSPMGAGNGRMF